MVLDRRNTEMERIDTVHAAQNEALTAYYGLLGFPHEGRLVPKAVNKEQCKLIRQLTADPAAAFDVLNSLDTEARSLEAAWDNLDPQKREEIARHGSIDLARAFGHSIMVEDIC